MTGERGTGPGGSPRLRVAEVFDGRGPTGGIVVDRPPVEPAEFEALTAYLTKAPVALATTKTGEDELSPGAGLVVPRAYHTDGEWIWPAAVGYYLHRYRLPPQLELVEHIRARGFRVHAVTEELRQAAAAQMLEALAAAKRGVGAAGAASAGAGAASAASGARAVPEQVVSASSSPAVPLYAPNPNPPEVKAAEPTLWMPAPAGAPQDPASSQDSLSFQEEASQDAASSLGAPSFGEPPYREAEFRDAEFRETPFREASFEAQLVGAEALGAPPLRASAGSNFFDPAPKQTVPQPPTPPSAGGPVAADAEPLTIPTFSAALTAAGNRHAAWVYEQIETFLGYMPLDEWSVNHGTRRYRQADREFFVDALGRLSHDGRWTWAWAEPGFWSTEPALTERSRLLRDEGGRLGIKELTAPVLDLSDTQDADDPEIAAEMMAWTAMGVAGARGYIGHTLTDEGRIYYLAFDETIPMAEPEIDGVPHFLSHGIAKFEEDATDCVLGYVEHYGWDWSRSSEGIVVSAGALGSFTVDLSEDGILTGISLHR